MSWANRLFSLSFIQIFRHEELLAVPKHEIQDACDLGSLVVHAYWEEDSTLKSVVINGPRYNAGHWMWFPSDPFGWEELKWDAAGQALPGSSSQP
jgi:hypothetical protein